jgi:hypothetical protein
MAKIDVTVLQPVVVVKNLIENIKKIDVKLGKLEDKEHLTVIEKQEKEELESAVKFMIEKIVRVSKANKIKVVNEYAKNSIGIKELEREKDLAYKVTTYKTLKQVIEDITDGSITEPLDEIIDKLK